MRRERRNAGTRQRRVTVAVCAILAAGVLVRLAYAYRCALGYDEVFVMGVGLDEIGASVKAFLFDVPARRSNAITPLWWWVQAVPMLIRGDLSLAGLRVMPMLLGVVTLWASWRVGAAQLGRGPAVMLLLFVAFSDVLAFSNARGEYAESLLVAAALPAALLVGVRRPAVKGLLWLTLLMTHLGKGGLIVAGLMIAEAIATWLRRPRPCMVSSLIPPIAIAVVPVLAWLFAAQWIVFAGGAVATDAGVRDSIWQAFGAVTVGYRETKPDMVASTFDALLPFLDGFIWPATTLLAVPMLTGVCIAVAGVIRRGTNARRDRLVVALLPWVVLGALLVIGRGQVGARFHLIYLPALWVIASIGLARLRQEARGWLWLGGVAWLVQVGVAFGWSSWLERTFSPSPATGLAIGGVAGVFVCVWWSTRARSRAWVSPAAVIVLLLVALGVYGPMQWGPAGRFDPMPGPADKSADSLLAALDRHRTAHAPPPPPDDRTLYLALSHYYLTHAGADEADAERSLHFAKQQTRRAPDDSRGWFYLGLARQAAGRSVDQVRAAWERAYELGPTPGLADRIRSLSSD